MKLSESCQALRHRGLELLKFLLQNCDDSLYITYQPFYSGTMLPRYQFNQLPVELEQSAS